MSFCSMMTWLDSFLATVSFIFFYYATVSFIFFYYVSAISWPPSLGLCILVSKEPGERQLPKQDEPMDKSPVKAVPCSPGGEWGRSGVTASYFINLHEASCHFVVC